MKEKLLNEVKDFVNTCNTMFKISAAEFANKYFTKLIISNWDDELSDEYNLKMIYDLFELNKKLNEVQGNTNVVQTIEAFQKDWLDKIK